MIVEFAMKCPVNLKLNDLGRVIRINENELVGNPENIFRKPTMERFFVK